MNSVGDTFVVPNPDNGQEHFYIVIAITETADPIAVNLTSTLISRSNCILQPGEHPWITKPSGVNFWDLKRPMRLAALRDGARGGIVRSQVPLGVPVVRRIISAARESRLFPDHLKRYLVDP